MRILIVCSKNSGRIVPFISEQVESLEREGVECRYFTIEGKGIIGYLSNFKNFISTIYSFNPDIIHAHYGLSGLFANIQRKIPVVTTYHGSDINQSKAYRFSKWAIRLSAWNIFVSQKNISKTKIKKHYSLLPCGVNISVFQPIDKMLARQQLGFDKMDKLVLFAGSFTNKVKCPELAIESVKQLKDVKLIELKGFTRNQVALLMNAVDVCLMTSYTEGSPQFIKEAMACNCPVVSVNVGDVADLLENTKGGYLVERDANMIANQLDFVIQQQIRGDGRDKIIGNGLDIDEVACKIVSLYKQIGS